MKEVEASRLLWEEGGCSFLGHGPWEQQWASELHLAEVPEGFGS